MKLGFLVLLGLFFAVPSYGYIDPGTSHLVWQFIAGIAIGMSFYIGKIRSVFGKILNKKATRKE